MAVAVVVVVFSSFEDQRFSVARAALRRCPKLETPSEFSEQIKQGVAPVRGRTQVCKCITASYDWQAFFSAMGNIKGLITGHTETQHTKARGEEAVHFWRFMRRENVELGVPIVEWPGYPQHPRDVVLLVKFYVSSTDTCDQLKVFLPAQVLAKLPDKPDQMTCRLEFSERHIKEIEKTAAFVRKAPWSMEAAGLYVDTLVKNNMAGTSVDWTLPELERFWDLGTKTVEVSAEHDNGWIPDEDLLPTAPQIPQIHPNVIARKPPRQRKMRKTADPELGDPSPAGPKLAKEKKPSPKEDKKKEKKKKKIACAKRPAPDDRLGCGTCRQSQVGCTACRKRKGMVVQDGAWAWPAALAAVAPGD